MGLSRFHEIARQSWREGVLALITLGSLAVMLALDPIAQDLAYHNFADKRVVAGIPNFFDVASNVPFLLVGALGCVYCRRRRENLEVRWAWLVFFAGVTFVSVGSAYYHWAPDNDRLVWDRLPMTVGFMGLFVGLLAEYLNPRWQLGLVPALLLGAASVWYWTATDDLRPYFWVQLVPLLTIPAVMILYRARYSHSSLLLVGLGCYLLAKGAELADSAIFEADGGAISGHTLKHLLAAAGPWCIYRMLVRRRLLLRGD